MYQQTNKTGKLFDVAAIVEAYIRDMLGHNSHKSDDLDIEITWPADAFTYHVTSTKKLSAAPPTLQLLNSQSFRNASQRTQTHTFRASRSSTATTTARITSGLIPPSQGFRISLPHGTSQSDLQLQHAATTVHESQQWDVNTPVKVRPGTVSIAQLLLEESSQSVAVTISTQIRGNIKVKATQHGRQIASSEYSLVDILRNSRLPEAHAIHGFNNREVLLLGTTGLVELRYGVTQRVNIEELPLTARSGRKEIIKTVPEEPKYPMRDSRKPRDVRIPVFTDHEIDEIFRPTKSVCNCIIL